MNIDPRNENFGEIKQFTEEEFLEAREQVQRSGKNVVQFGSGPISTILLDQERQAMEHFAQHERMNILRSMRSHNKSANRRAKKKIADASRRRNRK